MNWISVDGVEDGKVERYFDKEKVAVDEYNGG